MPSQAFPEFARNSTTPASAAEASQIERWTLDSVATEHAHDAGAASTNRGSTDERAPAKR